MLKPSVFGLLSSMKYSSGSHNAMDEQTYLLFGLMICKTKRQ
ncbi:hypothetical protein JCM19237_5538 [Photobacterium aphoticum]|uniref:Uncharacterized protein n=1 Tax=Photobacterium aphoticum TaxID=754436 RepID=A0A090QHM5_9GAMM|nr:hypothetical protein JCM19237_5538 [Photobacterium aphoticum]